MKTLVFYLASSLLWQEQSQMLRLGGINHDFSDSKKSGVSFVYSCGIEVEKLDVISNIDELDIES